jgi:hypothetical protein
MPGHFPPPWSVEELDSLVHDVGFASTEKP